VEEREYRLEHTKLLAAERDAINRLYYGFWIIFLGGFVLSMHVTEGRHPRATTTFVVIFRILAIAGTAANFAMQYYSLDSLTGYRRSVFHDAVGNRGIAEAAVKDSLRSGELANVFLLVLTYIGAAFLLVALVGSFFVRIP
jgi:hypothetical protein